MKNIVLSIGIVIIFVIAILLYISYKSVNTSPPVPPPPSLATPPTSPAAIAPGEEPAVILPSAPSQDASAQEKGEFAKFIHESARETAKMTFTKCTPSPTIARVREGTSFSFRNADVQTRRIRILDEYMISAGETKTITATLKNGAGVYGIICDDSQAPVGYLEIEPAK